MFPFDRMLNLVDGFAARFAPETFFAQVGEGAVTPKNIPSVALLKQREFGEKLREARLIIAHAGMGSIISAMDNRKPIVIFPRRVAFGEVNTDHQLATARWLSAKPGIHVAMDDADLEGAVRAALAAEDAGAQVPKQAPAEFLERIRGYIARA